MRSNKFSFMLLIILIMCLFASCKASDNHKSSSDNLEANLIQTKADADANILDATVNERSAYLVDPNHIIKYDLASGERSIVKSISGNTAICVDQDSIYTYNQQENTIVKYNMSGEEKKFYPCAFDPIDAVRMKIFEKTIVIVASYANNAGYTESELYLYDISTGKNKKITPNFKGDDSYSLIIGLDFVDKDIIMISSVATTSTMHMVVKGYRFNLQKERVLEEYILPNSNAFSYEGKKDCFYYVENSLLKEFNHKSSTVTTVNKIENTSSNSYGNKEHNPVITRVVDRIFCSEDAAILYNNSNNAIHVIGLASDTKTIHIIHSNTLSNNLNITSIIEQFENKYGYNVQATEYTQDVFNKKLHTKLLAGDKDFDIYLIDEPNQDNLLGSILSYDLFDPLDNYSEIVNNFSNMYKGIQPMMSYNEKLFGVPYKMNISTLMAINMDFQQYGYTAPNKDWSYNEVWKLCDDIIRSGEQKISVFKDPYGMIYFVQLFVQEAINQNKLDKSELIKLLTNIKKYYDANVLFDNSGSNKYLVDYAAMFFWSFISHSEVADYPQLGTIVFPAFNDKSYVDLQGCAFINKFSTNKELAAKFIEWMTSSENIYNTKIYITTLLGPDLTKYDIYDEWSSTELSYLSDLPSLYNNTGVLRIIIFP